MCCYPDVLSLVQHGEPVDRLRVFVPAAVLSSAGIPEFVRLDKALQADSGVGFSAGVCERRCCISLQLQLPLLACM